MSGYKLSILEGFAKRLRSCFRSGDTVAKWTAQNQFIVMLPYLSAVRDAGKISRLILQTLKSPFDVETNQIYAKTSIGITLQQDELKKAETLLNELNHALEKSKNTGGK